MMGPAAAAGHGVHGRDALLAEVEAACAEGAADPTRLARPLRVLVPSGALREHLAAALVARAGSARLGVRFETLDALAREVLARAGETAVPDILHPVEVRELARGEPALAEALDPLDDGYAAVVASVDDLLDAGFTPGHAEALSERLAEVASGALRARGEALLRVAAGACAAHARGEVGHRATLLARAHEHLRDAPDDAPLPLRALWIYGFTDATGVQLDLLETLARRFPARVWIDAAAPASGFGVRLRERLTATGALRVADALPAPALEASRHADPEDEARAAALWARAQLDAGTAPERVAVVARDLSAHRLALRRQLHRHGVPFSGAGERGAPGPVSRRLGALLDLLERGRALPTERWLDALGAQDPGQLADLRDALHALAIPTLGDLADAASGRFARPARLQTPRALAHLPDGRRAATRREVAPGPLLALRARARAALDVLAAAPPRAALAERVAQLASLTEALAWDDATPGRGALAQALPEPHRAGARPVPAEDWSRLLRRVLADAGRDPLGGRGGGVQVLSVMEARGCRFDALRVIGLARGAFPRRVGEDPLLPDALRRSLRVLLPDLPVKAEGHEEERFLFAQLLGAAPAVSLSCARSDARGRQAAPSPLFERVGATPVDAPPPARRAARDAWRDAALTGGRGAFPAALSEAIAAGRRAVALPEGDVLRLARARRAVLDELDGRGARRASLGPYLGVLGSPRSDVDPRRDPPFVTALEGLARCPWQHFLERVLGLAPVPDPWRVLPGTAVPQLVGNVVHSALERVVAGEADSPWPAELPFPVLRAAARAQVRREAIALPGFAEALAHVARGYVEVARRLDLAEAPAAVLVEVGHEVSVGEGEDALRLGFRADRSDEVGGARRLTDWKTGAAKVPGPGPARERALARLAARGVLLQAHAYALTGARGRYVFLRPDLDDAVRVVEADPSQRAAFEAAVATLWAARARGALPPRLRDPDRDQEPDACRRCDVKQACLRGDSGVRLRLGRWADAADDAGSELGRAALAVWRLPAVEP